LKKIVLVLSLIIVVSLIGCAKVPVYNPPIEPIVETPIPIDYTPATSLPPSVVVGIPVNKDTPDPTPTQVVVPLGVVVLPKADYPIPVNSNLSGIGKPLKTVEIRTNWLKLDDVVSIGSTPIYNAEFADRIFSLTYGIFEKKDGIIPAPSYFKDFVSTYSLVNVPARSWVDVPVVFKIPKGTENLPTVPVYFNIAIHDISNNGNLQFQAAERWEITFK
jgi:hypothetical protein